MARIARLCSVMLALLLFSTGCGSEKASDEKNFAVVVDQMGSEVIVKSAPKRIVSLAPSHTETAFAIGLGDSMVGVSDHCNYPEEALKISKVGGFSKPNIEAVLALNPDLVLAGNKHEEAVKKLRELNIPVLVLIPESLEDVFEAMVIVGEATGKRKEAEAVIEGLKDRLKKIESRVGAIPEQERVRVYYEVSSDPLMSAGAASLINEVISLAGGINIFSDVAETYPKISEEVLILRDPQFILFPKSHGSIQFEPQKIASRPLWDKITAVKENRLFSITTDAISRPGPRLVDAVEELAAIFYPEKK